MRGTCNTHHPRAAGVVCITGQLNWLWNGDGEHVWYVDLDSVIR